MKLSVLIMIPLILAKLTSVERQTRKELRQAQLAERRAAKQVERNRERVAQKEKKLAERQAAKISPRSLTSTNELTVCLFVRFSWD